MLSMFKVFSKLVKYLKLNLEMRHFCSTDVLSDPSKFSALSMHFCPHITNEEQLLSWVGHGHVANYGETFLLFPLSFFPSTLNTHSLTPMSLDQFRTAP